MRVGFLLPTSKSPLPTTAILCWSSTTTRHGPKRLHVVRIGRPHRRFGSRSPRLVHQRKIKKLARGFEPARPYRRPIQRWLPETSNANAQLCYCSDYGPGRAVVGGIGRSRFAGSGHLHLLRNSNSLPAAGNHGRGSPVNDRHSANEPQDPSSAIPDTHRFTNFI